MDELAKAEKALANAQKSNAPEDEIQELELYVADLQGKQKDSGKTSSVTVEGISPEQWNRMKGAAPGAILGHPVGKYIKNVFEGAEKAAEARQNVVPGIPTNAEGVPTSRVDRILYGTLEDGSSSLARQEGQHVLQQQLAERAKSGQKTIEQLARQGVPGVDPNIIAKSENLIPTNRGILTTVQQAQALEDAPTSLAAKAKSIGAGAKDLWKGVQYAGTKGWGPVLGHTMGGIGFGTGLADTINRAKSEDPVGAIISGVGTLGSAMSFVPGYGLIGMGIGAGAPALNELRDRIKKGDIGQGVTQTHENMNPAGDVYASGGLVHLNGGGQPNVSLNVMPMTAMPNTNAPQNALPQNAVPLGAIARMQLEKELENKARMRAGVSAMGMALPNQPGVKMIPDQINAGYNTPVGPGRLDLSANRSINPVPGRGHMQGINAQYTVPFKKGGEVKKFAAGELVESTGETEPSLSDAFSNIYKGLTSPEQWAEVGEALHRTRKAIPGVAESVARGAVAAVPGTFGDIESLGRTGINTFQKNLGELSGTQQGTVGENTALPTTRDILNYVPRVTPTHEGAETVEDVGSFIGPAIGVLGKDIALLSKNAPIGLSIKDVTPPQRLLAPKNELGAYSALEEAALNLKQNKGTSDQLYNMLLKEPGVKQEELQYRGLDALLKGKNEPMTKEGILAHLKENEMPSITERKLGDKYATEGEPDYGNALDEWHNNWRNAELDDAAMTDEYNYRRYDDTDWHDERKREYMEENGLDEEAFDADPIHQKKVDDILEQDAQSSAEDYGPYVIAHRDSGYEIHGNNYGDVSLHGPNGHIGDYRNVDEAQAAALDHAMENDYLSPDYLEGPGASQYHGYVGSGNGNYEEQLFHHDPVSGSYHAPHFENESDNLLMHMRRQDAENPEGKKILKIEEQQSDWHQAGKKKGYEDPNMPRSAIKAKLDDLQTQKNEAISAWENTPDDAPNMPEIKAKLKFVSDEYDSLAEKYHSGAVPNAPLKKGWNEFLMKKALHDAAVGDYDKLAWTTGKTQAQRYNKMLEDAVSEVHYAKDPATNRYDIKFKKPGDTSTTPYSMIHESDLENHFGEHIANQMKNNLGETIPYIEHHPEGTNALREMGTSGYHFKTPENMESFTGFGSTPEEAKADLIKTIPRLADKYVIKGDNISIGNGRGMQGFYDKMQGDFLNKFLKKYGEKVHTDQVLGNMNPEEVNAVNITPEMRKDLTEKGFPMFKEGGLVHLR